MKIKHYFTAGAAFISAPTCLLAQATDTSNDVKEAEIVVTAQRRAQNIQDIPISVSSFSGDALQDRGVVKLRDIADQIPAVTIYDQFGSSQPIFTIRGVGLLDFNPNNTPAAPIYYDGIYQVSNVMTNGALYDVQQIEVLKGPQGGLYGRNTTGGAVLVESRAPSFDRPDVRAVLRYARFGVFGLDAGAGVPLNDNLAVRVSGRLEQGGDGWQRSLVDGRRWGAPDLWSVRGQIKAKVGERVTALVKVEGGQDNSQTVLPRAIGAYRALGEFCPALQAGARDDANCLTFGGAIAQTLGIPGEPLASVQNASARTVLASPINRLANRDFRASGKIDVDLGVATLTSITGYTNFKFGQTLDLDATPGVLGHQVEGGKFTVFSQELLLTSASKSPISWLAGVSYGFDRFDEKRQFIFTDNVPVTLQLGLPAPSLGVADLSFRQTTRSYSAFGQVRAELSKLFAVSGELRWIREKKTYRNGALALPLADVVLFQNISADYNSGGDIVGKGVVEFRPSSDIMGYASISRGFKAGGFFGGFPLATSGVITPYREEKVWAYELGLKTRFADGRVVANVAAYRYDYSDVQGFGNVLSEVTNTIVPALTNVAGARHYGLEGELFVIPTNWLRLEATGAYLDAKYRNSMVQFLTVDGVPVSYNGLRRLYAPEWSYGLAATASYPVGGDLRGSVRIDYNWRSQLGTGFVTKADTVLGEVPGYGLLGARVEFSGPQDRWSVAIFGQNITNQRYVTVRNGDGFGSFTEYFGPPMIWGAELSFKF